MAKRKVNSDDFVEEDENSKSSQRPQKQKFKSLKDDSDSDLQEVDELAGSKQDEPLSKFKSEKKTKSDETIVKNTPDGDKYVDLGKKKRATVRSFKGTPLIDIREFYGSDGDEKPGKKGISLTLEQWESLKKNIETLDNLFAAMKKK